MKFKLVLSLFFLAFAVVPAIAQNFVGLVQYRNTFQYIKISCKDGKCQFGAPDLDNNKKYPTSTDVTANAQFEVLRGIELWKFNGTLADDKLSGQLELPTGTQSFVLYEQKEALPEEELKKYCGTFADEQNRKAVIYAQNGYLHLMSPYSEETVSLKPIAKNHFWSATGETTVYTNDLKSLQMTNHSGGSFALKRESAIQVEEHWIMLGEDTIYGKMFSPGTEGKHPACLILPGGGGIGIDNYIFEARYLASHGVTCLVFDKAGNGKSKGPTFFRAQTFEDKNDQYIELFHYLRKQPNVDPDRVGVHGPSEGGRLALMMAIDLGDTLAFAYAVAAPLMTLREGQLYAMDHYHRQRNVSESDNMMLRQIWNHYYDGICANKIDSTYFPQIRMYAASRQDMFLPPAGTSIPLSPRKEDIDSDRVVQEAGKITCPILFQYGEVDQRVNGPKSLANFLPRLHDSVKTQVIYYPRGTHSFMTPEFKICTGYEDDKLRWLKCIGILE